MQNFVNLLTQTEILVESNMLAILVYLYLLLELIIVVSFINIYQVDKNEFLNNKQKCFWFKRKIPFIIMYSKQKNIVSKKTFIFETIGYIISLLLIVSCVFSLRLNVKIAYIILAILSIIVLIFGCLTGYLYIKIKK